MLEPPLRGGQTDPDGLPLETDLITVPGPVFKPFATCFVSCSPGSISTTFSEDVELRATSSRALSSLLVATEIISFGRRGDDGGRQRGSIIDV